MGHRAVAKQFVRVEHGMYVHVDQLLPEKTDTGWTRLRRIPAATLVLAHLLRHPQRIADGFAAGAVIGMRSFVEEELLDVLAPPGATVARAPDHVRLTPTRLLDRYAESALSLPGDLGHLRYTDPGAALSRMLRTVAGRDADRDRRWKVPDLSEVRPGFTPEFLRCVQVSDSLHQGLCMQHPGTPEELRRPGGVDPVLASRVLGFTDVGAESPQETLLRLAVSDLAPGLRSQIPVWKDDGRGLLTASDLGWEERGLHLFYDGEHHRQQKQRDHDSKVLAALQRDGGRILRVVAEDLATVDAVVALRERVSEALG